MIDCNIITQVIYTPFHNQFSHSNFIEIFLFPNILATVTSHIKKNVIWATTTNKGSSSGEQWTSSGNHQWVGVGWWLPIVQITFTWWIYSSWYRSFMFAFNCNVTFLKISSFHIIPCKVTTKTIFFFSLQKIEIIMVKAKDKNMWKNSINNTNLWICKQVWFQQCQIIVCLFCISVWYYQISKLKLNSIHKLIFTMTLRWYLISYM